MKTLLLVLSLLAATYAAQAQILNCEYVRNGKFRMEGDELSYIYMDRKGKSQMEESGTGLKIKYSVNWTNECSYTLKVTKVMENPEEENVNMNEIITVKIIATDDDHYIEERHFATSGKIKKQLIYIDM